MRDRFLAVAFVVLSVLAGDAHAAVSLSASGTLATSAIAPAAAWQAGSAGARYLSGLAASANGTTVSGTLLARAGADLYVSDALRLANARASPVDVVLSSTQATGAGIEVFRWLVYDGTTLVGTLDLMAASPSLSFTLPASTTYRLDARVDVADGGGAHNLPASFTLGVRTGSATLSVQHPTSSPSVSVSAADIAFGQLAAGSTVGANATNGSASVAGRVAISGTDNVLYVNNTASSPSYVKAVYTSGTAGLSSLSTFNIGVNNGTASLDQIKIASGSVTQASGSYHRIEPSTTARLYATTLEGVLFSSGTATFDVYVSDTASGDSYYVMKGSITVT